MTKPEDEKTKPSPEDLDTLEVEADEVRPTSSAAAPSPEDMMVHFQQTGELSAEDFNAMIMKQLQQTGGILTFEGALAAEEEETSSEPPPAPVSELGKTGAISAREVAANAFPFMETSAMPASVAVESPTAHEVWEAPTAPAPPQHTLQDAPSPWDAPSADTDKQAAADLSLQTHSDPEDPENPQDTPTDRKHLNVSAFGSDIPLPSGDEISISQLDAVMPEDPLIGRVVVDRYRIVGLLGKGGMGKVFRATQLGLNRDVAVKMLHPQLATERESRMRFQREAQSMTRFSHQNVAGVYDFGEWEGQFFIAMELLEGESLSKYIEKGKAMEHETILRIMNEACSGLSAAHGAGVVHRDLKPENIVILKDSGTVKLVDFGLAMLRDTPEEERLTVEGMTIGTPHYMSPEQCQGMEVDIRSDVYAMGCILYEMLCGEIPFWGDSLMAIMMQQLFSEPIPPSQRKGGFNAHPYLDALAMKALAKVPDERPQTIDEFIAELQKVSGEQQAPTRGSMIELADRDARASALGLPHLSGRVIRAPTKFAEVLFLVVENPDEYTDSMTMGMWSNGFTVKQLATLAEAIGEIPTSEPGGIVVDITGNPGQLFEELITAFGSGVFQHVAVTIVGPDESFDMMTLALEMGAFDYVPVGSVKQKLPKSLRRIAKKHAKKMKKKAAE